MGREALAALEVPEAEIARVEEEYRARDLERLEIQTRTGDLHALKDRIFRPGHSLRDEA
jgi:hypothetical protein